ncbi:MAG: hypothetical protein GXO43_01600 [Crenarchaeota archaeon]|nr:hypothetical protein [Thermoproteota archaeon]
MSDNPIEYIYTKTGFLTACKMLGGTPEVDEKHGLVACNIPLYTPGRKEAGMLHMEIGITPERKKNLRVQYVSNSPTGTPDTVVKFGNYEVRTKENEGTIAKDPSGLSLYCNLEDPKDVSCRTLDGKFSIRTKKYYVPEEDSYYVNAIGIGPTTAKKSGKYLNDGYTWVISTDNQW